MPFVRCFVSFRLLLCGVVCVCLFVCSCVGLRVPFVRSIVCSFVRSFDCVFACLLVSWLVS